MLVLTVPVRTPKVGFDLVEMFASFTWLVGKKVVWHRKPEPPLLPARMLRVERVKDV